MFNFFDRKFGVIKNICSNLAYWNLHERTLTRSIGSDYLVNGSKLKFMHFSKIDKFHSICSSEGSNPVSLLRNPEFMILYDNYIQDLLKFGFQRWRAMPYRYDYFE